MPAVAGGGDVTASGRSPGRRGRSGGGGTAAAVTPRVTRWEVVGGQRVAEKHLLDGELAALVHREGGPGMGQSVVRMVV